MTLEQVPQSEYPCGRRPKCWGNQGPLEAEPQLSSAEDNQELAAHHRLLMEGRAEASGLFLSLLLRPSGHILYLLRRTLGPLKQWSCFAYKSKVFPEEMVLPWSPKLRHCHFWNLLAVARTT